jgi:hypothetical protein
LPDYFDVELFGLIAAARADAFDDGARELESIRDSAEAEAAFKRGAEILRAIAARERA